MKKPIAVEINIPYCIKASEILHPMSVVGTNAEKDAYMQALMREIEAWEGQLDDYEIQTVHLGGENATVMSPDLLGQALALIRKLLPVAPQAQFSFDAVPNTVGTPCLTGISAGHVTRAELIMRSQKDAELKAAGCPFNSQDISNALLFFNKFRLNDLSATVNFGLPGQTLASWNNCLRYCAMNGIHSVRIKPVAAEFDTELGYEMFLIADETLTALGYRHYAAGCFSLPGHEDSAELLINRGAEILGLGAGAVSTVDGLISRNTNNTRIYINNAGDFEKQTAEVFEADGSYQMLSFAAGALKSSAGLDFEVFYQRFGKKPDDELKSLLGKLCESGLAEYADNSVRPTMKGLYRSLFLNRNLRLKGRKINKGE